MTIIAVDFDGVVHDEKHPVPGRRMGPPMPGAIEGMRRLARRSEVVVFTVRGGDPRHVEDWLNYYGISFSRVTNIKERFDFIIDDHAVHFTSWDAIE